MYQMTVVLIKRATRFSPHQVENDQRILENVGERLNTAGYRVMSMIDEEMNETSWPQANVYVSMGRCTTTLSALSQMQKEGHLVMNNPEGVRRCCHRASLMQLLEENNIPVPPLEGHLGYWVKRGDGPTEREDDVVFVTSWKEALSMKKKMFQRGVSDVDIRAHVAGQWVKFYGVCGTDFFRYYHLEGDRSLVTFDADSLWQTANRIAALIKVDVYGGDAIVREDGTFVIVDFNDWPSFSACRDEAAKAVVKRINQLVACG